MCTRDWADMLREVTEMGLASLRDPDHIWGGKDRRTYGSGQYDLVRSYFSR